MIQYLILINIMCLFDTCIKYLFMRRYDVYRSKIINIYIQPVYNYGFVYGLHKNSELRHKIFLHIGTIGMVGILYLLTKNMYILGTLLVSFYNLFDRIKNGYIIDYINLNLFNKIYIPVFNLTDVIILFNLILFSI